MRNWLALPLFTLLFLAAGALARQSPSVGAGENAQVIEMTAKKYEYNPSILHVKKGTRVQLKIKALDRAHGFKIALYPEGAEEKGAPGLLFDSPPNDWRIEKDKVEQIEFVAAQAGTYDFKCSRFCGFGHPRMKGQLVVEP